MVDLLVGSEVNSKRIAHIESCFGRSGTPLALRGRVLVGEGVLTKMCRKGPKPRQFFLFNDILVYGKILRRKKMYVKQNIIPLEEVVLEDLPDDKNEGLKNGWLIKTPNKSFAVYAQSTVEKEDWIQHIQKCVKNLLKRTGKTPIGEHAAVWVPDTEAKVCMHCNTAQFSLLNRRHHCRNCGDVICASCSRNRFLIPSQSPKPVRVCDSCNSKLVQHRLGEKQHSHSHSTRSHDSRHNVSNESVNNSGKSSSLKNNRRVSGDGQSSTGNPVVLPKKVAAPVEADGHKNQIEESSDTDDDIEDLNAKMDDILGPLEDQKPTFYNVSFNVEEGKEDQKDTEEKEQAQKKERNGKEAKN